MRFEQPVQPEAVIAGLVARDDFDPPPHLPADTHRYPLHQRYQFLPVAGFHRVAADPVGQRRVHRHDPIRLAQFDCKKTPHHVIISRGGQVVHCAVRHHALQALVVGFTPNG